jgi:hypothetical protein
MTCPGFALRILAPGTGPSFNADAGPTSPSTRPTKSQIVNLECPGSTHEWGDTNAPRTPGDLRRRGDDNLYIPFSNIEQRRKTGLQRQGASAKHSRRHEILPAKLADDRVHGSRWSGQQDWRRPDNQAVRALMTGWPERWPEMITFAEFIPISRGALLNAVGADVPPIRPRTRLPR